MYKLVVRNRPLKSTVWLWRKILGVWIPLQSAYVRTANNELRKQYIDELIESYAENYKITYNFISWK